MSTHETLLNLSSNIHCREREGERKRFGVRESECNKVRRMEIEGEREENKREKEGARAYQSFQLTLERLKFETVFWRNSIEIASSS